MTKRFSNKIKLGILASLIVSTAYASELVSVEKNGSYKLGNKNFTKYEVTCSGGFTADIYYNSNKSCWMKTSSLTCDYSSDPDALRKSAKTLCGNH